MKTKELVKKIQQMNFKLNSFERKYKGENVVEVNFKTKTNLTNGVKV